MRINFKKTSYVFSFKSKGQLALFEIVKEYYVNSRLEFAKIIFQIKGKEYKRIVNQ
jgi:cell fate regulator YaaT (PSP1 superfamily)